MNQYNNYFTITGGSSVSSNSAYIYGGGGGGLWLNQNNDHFTITGGSSVSYNQALYGGGGGYGGGIYMESSNNHFTISGNSLLTGNRGSNGGAIEAHQNNIYFTITGNSTLSNNYASFYGGAIMAFSGNNDFTISGGSSVTGNVSPQGGGIFVGYGNNYFTITGSSSVTHNTATSGGDTSCGGGIFVGGGNNYFTINGSSYVTHNTGGLYGGGICLLFSGNNDFTITGNSYVSDNTAPVGGGFYLDSSNEYFTISDSSYVTHNTANMNGGGIFSGSGNNHFTIEGNSYVSDNSATTSGGGIYLSTINNFFAITLNSSVSGNSAANGGGIYLYSENKYFVINGSSTIRGNVATTSGGGIYLYQGNNYATITYSSSVIDNIASIDGGGIYLSTSNTDFTITDRSSVTRNYAANGGGLYLNKYNDYCTISGSASVSDNSAASGGDIYLLYGYNYGFSLGGNSSSMSIFYATDSSPNTIKIYAYSVTDSAAVSSNCAGTTSATSSNNCNFRSALKYCLAFIGTTTSTMVSCNIVLAEGSSHQVSQLSSEIDLLNAASVLSTYPVSSSTRYLSLSISSPSSSNKANVTGTSGQSMRFLYLDSSTAFTPFNIVLSSFSMENIKVSSFGSSSIIGGAFYIYGESSTVRPAITFTNCLLTGNTASSGGAAYFGNTNGSVFHAVSCISNSAASGGGGCIYVNSYNDHFTITGGSTISDNTATNGHGGGIFLSQANNYFTITGGSSVSYNTASGAVNGGGIYLQGSNNNYFTITGNSTVSHNTAGYRGGAIYTESVNNYFTISESSSVSYNYAGIDGGGVCFNGGYYFTITGSFVNGNSAPYRGGGIHMSSTTYTTISDSSFFDNTVTSVGGGGISLYSYNNYFTITNNTRVYNNHAPQGAGIHMDFSNEYVTISTNSDVSYNSASDSGGGIYLVGPNNNYFTITGNSSVTHNTATASGGGIYLGSSNSDFTITGSSSVSSNTASSSGGGIYLSASNNYFVVTNSSYVTHNTASVNGGGIYLGSSNNDFAITGSSYVSDNSATSSGGGIYLSTSNNYFSITDSSDVRRNIATTSGGGIYLSSSNSYFTITSNSSVLHNTAGVDGGGIYLRSGNHEFAISDSSYVYENVASNGGGIYFSSSNNGSTITGSSSVTYNTATTSGGGIYLSATNYHCTITDSASVAHNTAATSGGGIYLSSSNNYFIITNSSSVTYNSAGLDGGGIYLGSSNDYFTITDSSPLSYNTASNGGGIYLSSSNDYFTITGHLDVTHNSATIAGGGIYLSSSNSDFTITDNSLLSYNTAPSGGAIYLSSSNDYFTITGSSSVTHNTASVDGGGIYLYQYNLNFTITETSSIAENTAATSGGGIYLSGYNNGFNITGSSSVSHNTASTAGGGIYLSTSNSYFIVSGVSIFNNTASSGGGIYLSSSNSYFTISGSSSVTYNTATTSGGAIYLSTSNSYFTITGSSVVTHNTATTSGGGIYLSTLNSYFTISGGSSITGHSASLGGGIYLASANTYFTITDGSTVSDNTATTSGGGIYVYQTNSMLEISSAVLSNNTATSSFGGAIYFDTSNFKVAITDTVIADNTAGQFGGAIYVYTSNYKFTIWSCTIKNNIATSNSGGGALVLFSSNTELLIWNCRFVDNSATTYAGAALIGAVNHGITFRATSFENNTVTSGSGGAIWFGFGNYDINFDNSSFANNRALGGTSSSGGAVYVYQYSGMPSLFQSFFGITGKYSGSAILPISFSSCSFYSNYAAGSGGAIYSSDSTNTIKASGRSRFTGNSCGQYGGAISLAGSTLFEFSRVAVSSSTDNFTQPNGDFDNSYGSYETYTTTLAADIDHDSLAFYDNSAGISGGAVYVSTASTCTFDQTTSLVFSGNTAVAAGGAIYVTSSSTCTINKANSLVFSGNVANESSGGAVMVSSSSAMNIISSRNVTLFGNRAAYGGLDFDIGSGNTFNVLGSTVNVTRADAGVTLGSYTGSHVYWIDSTTAGSTTGTVSLNYGDIDNANYTKWTCTESGGGTSSASYPPYCLSTQSTQIKLVYSSGREVTVYSTNATGSGNIIRKLGLYDGFGQLNVSDYSSTVTATVSGSNCSTSKGSVTGTATVTVNKGIASFSKLSASCYPGGTANLTFTASLNGLGSTYAVTHMETISFRGCLNGEILRGGVCFACAAGTYSFAFDSNVPACTACPTNSDSCYGDKISVSPGYWRIGKKSTKFQQCPLGSQACVGGYDAAGIDTSSSSVSSNSSTARRQLSSASSSRSCAAGYIGPLCGVCGENYYLSGSACLSCSGQGGGAVLALVAYIIVPLVMLAIVIAVVIFNIRKAVDAGGEGLKVGTGITKYLAGVDDDVADGREGNNEREGQRNKTRFQAEAAAAHRISDVSSIASPGNSGFQFFDRRRRSSQESGGRRAAGAGGMSSNNSENHADHLPPPTQATSSWAAMIDGGWLCGVGIPGGVAPGSRRTSNNTHDIELFPRQPARDSIAESDIECSSNWIIDDDDSASGVSFPAVAGGVRNAAAIDAPPQEEDEVEVPGSLGLAGRFRKFLTNKCLCNEKFLRGYDFVTGKIGDASKRLQGRSLGSKLRILITALQIVIACPNSFQVIFPPITSQLYHALSFVNFVGIKIGDPQCYSPRRIDYIDKLVIQTSAPIAIILLFIIAGVFHVLHIKQQSLSDAAGAETKELDEQKRKEKISAAVGLYLSMIFLVIYLVLPGVTTTIAGMIPTTNVDPDGIYPDRNYHYMTNDLGTSVTSTRYQFGVAWATVMFFVYPVGVTCLYAFVLYINRESIMAKPRRYADDSKKLLAPPLPPPPTSTSHGEEGKTSGPTFVDKVREYITPDAILFLHGAYEGEFWYWELLETSRRLFLTALLSVVSAGSPAQIIFGIFLAMIYMKLYAYFQPYDYNEDDFLQELAQYQIFITFFIALIVQSDLCPGYWWTALFDTVLVATTAFTLICTKLMALGYYDRIIAVVPKRMEGPETYITAKELFGRDPGAKDANPLGEGDSTSFKADSEMLGKFRRALAKAQSKKNAPYFDSSRPPIAVLTDAINNALPYPDDELHYDGNGALAADTADRRSEGDRTA